MNLLAALLWMQFSPNYITSTSLDCANKDAADCKLEFGLQLMRKVQASQLKADILQRINWSRQEISKSSNAALINDSKEYVTFLETALTILDKNVSFDEKIKGILAIPRPDMDNIARELRKHDDELYDDEFKMLHLKCILKAWHELYAELLKERPNDLEIFPEYKKIDERLSSIEKSTDIQEKFSKMTAAFKDIRNFF